ncbi:hypothetical protein Q9233_004229 [Columba guinea]|nr:hypothetical protein Q9233_004229 [Columba guinea]
MTAEKTIPIINGKPEDALDPEASSTNLVHSNDKKVHERGHWNNKVEFVLSVAGEIIGLGNVWRFPYLCYKNGGGIGYATQVIEAHLNVYYIIILAWAIFYLFNCFTTELPWATCGHEWNTGQQGNGFAVSGGHSQEDSLNIAIEFLRRVLAISDGIEHIGNLRWELALCLLAAWTICYFCIWKGTKSTGKVVYVTATFPYIMLMILLIRGVTLPGASEGIKFYLYPDLSRLSDPQVWVDAGTQIFFSYAICLGCLTALGSYNNYNNNCYRETPTVGAPDREGTGVLETTETRMYPQAERLQSCPGQWRVLGRLNVPRNSTATQVALGLAVTAKMPNVLLHKVVDCIMLCCLNSGTSFVAGFAIFSVLGFMAYEQGVPIAEVAESGRTGTKPRLQWIQQHSKFVCVESLVTAVVDMYPKVFRRGYRRELLILGLSIVSYFIGLIMLTEGGMYVFQLFDSYAASGMCLLFVAIFECVCIGWVYGSNRFYENIEDMIGYKPLTLIKWCWMVLTPGICAGIFIFFLVKYKPLKYNNVYIYPDWGYGIGWLMALSSMICIPLWICIKLWKTEGTFIEDNANVKNKTVGISVPGLPWGSLTPLALLKDVCDSVHPPLRDHPPSEPGGDTEWTGVCSVQ